MTTITIDSTSTGSVLASNGRLTGLRYLAAPDKALRSALFALVDGSTGQTLYRIDLAASPWAVPLRPGPWFVGDPAGPITWHNWGLIDGAAIPFGQLLCQACPSGAKLELDWA
jgi:hypothetical protein